MRKWSFRKQKASTPAQPGETRRSWFEKIGLAALVGSLVGQTYAFFRSLVPDILYESPRRFKIGTPDQFAEGVTFLEDKRLFVFRQGNVFYAISAVCTHLGCTVKLINLPRPKRVRLRGQLVEFQREFHCPCHGSRYYGDGTNYAGPAPRPLPWIRLELAPEDGQLIADLSQPVERGFRLTVSA